MKGRAVVKGDQEPAVRHYIIQRLFQQPFVDSEGIVALMPFRCEHIDLYGCFSANRFHRFFVPEGLDLPKVGVIKDRGLPVIRGKHLLFFNQQRQIVGNHLFRLVCPSIFRVEKGGNEIGFRVFNDILFDSVPFIELDSRSCNIGVV